MIWRQGGTPFHAPAGLALYRYFLVGGASAITDWLLFAILLYLADWNYLLSAVVSFCVATLVNYLLCLFYVFSGGRHQRHVEAILVYVVSAIGLLIHLFVLYSLVEYFGVNEMVSKVIATGTTFLWNFSSRYMWIFDHRTD